MAVSIKDIQKLREMTGAGLADCKKALEESNGEIEPAVEIIRKKGQAVAAKRSDREASEGCVVVKADGNFAAIIIASATAVVPSYIEALEISIPVSSVIML